MAPGAMAPPPLTPLDEAVSKPPAGIILPPADLRDVLERTAGFVVRNGSHFEDRVREKEAKNPKFSFLHPGDAYHAYYQWRLSEIKEGRGTDVSAGRVGESAQRQPEAPKGPEQPPEFEFSAKMPPFSAVDLEVVRLTALFTAKNGRNFVTSVSHREGNNPGFGFLRPQHTMYQFFQRLVEQYKLLLEADKEKERIQQAQDNLTNKYDVIDRAKKRAEWVKYQATQKVQKEEEEEAEKVAFAQIDWHDFLIVETITFDESDELADLPAPPTINDLQTASLEQKGAMSLQPSNMRIEEAFPSAEDSFYTHPDAQQYPPYSSHGTNLPPTSTHGSNLPGQQPSYLVQDEEEERRIRERAEERERAAAAHLVAKGQAPMNIRKDYVPRAQAKRQNQQMVICPNCKQKMPADELDQHMRGTCQILPVRS